jgi:hypothetical protein
MMALLAAGLIAGCATGTGGGMTKGVVRHVVIFKFKEGAPADAVRSIEEKFRGLQARIPEIVDFEWGTNVSPENLNQGFTHCFLVTFRDPKARDAYLPHPAHKEFVEVLKPHLDKAFVIDYVARD